MRRKDIKLLADARGGSLTARAEVGKRYLMGTDGFQRHVPTGLEYFKCQGTLPPEFNQTIAESLSLPELIEYQQINALRSAAEAGNVSAQLKLGIWTAIREPDTEEGSALINSAQENSYTNDQAFASEPDGYPKRLVRLLNRAGFGSDVGLKVLMLAARESAKECDFLGAARLLAVAFRISPKPTDEMADVVFACVRSAEEMGQEFAGLSPRLVQDCLERRTCRLDYKAAYILGRALCAIDCGKIPARNLVQTTNFRKGAALLLRAGDKGRVDAWLYLHRLHSNHELSVANPEMARFCLEKAADAGNVVGQRKLGVLILRESGSLLESERGISWLAKASRSGDKLASDLLKTLVFPVAGLDVEAEAAIDEVARITPWLAVRLHLSRDFGLSKLEALTVDPFQGEREWGLVVGVNQFSLRIRISAPRAVPAISEGALGRLRTAARFFSQLKQDGNTSEGDLRRRAMTQRAAFKRHRLREAMFFAKVTSSQLDAMRLGPKWAHRQKALIAMALADAEPEPTLK